MFTRILMPGLQRLQRGVPETRGGIRRASLLAVLLCAPVVMSVAQADGDVRTVQAFGQGGDREAAVVEALGDALRQVHGGNIATRRETVSSLHRIARDGERTTRSERRVNSSASVAVSGLIGGYRVVSIDSDGRGGIAATLEVDVPVYDVRAVQAKRKRIAVYPVESYAPAYQIADTRLTSSEASERLTQSIVSMLVQSGRFSVLDRDMRDAIEREHGFLGRADVPLAEKLAIGHTLGADLLLVTRLRDFDARTVQSTDRWTGEVRSANAGAAVLEARVVMPSTGQLMWSRTVTLDASGFPRPMRVQSAFDTLARHLVSGLLEGIYPIRVVDGFGSSAVISQGGDLMRLGDRFEVFEIGRRYDDPYHGESLGARERRVALVEIVSVGAKTSRVQVIDGSVAGDGHVLRQAPSLAAGMPAERRATSPDTTRSRPKICLPGDPC